MSLSKGSDRPVKQRSGIQYGQALCHRCGRLRYHDEYRARTEARPGDLVAFQPARRLGSFAAIPRLPPGSAGVSPAQLKNLRNVGSKGFAAETANAAYFLHGPGFRRTQQRGQIFAKITCGSRLQPRHVSKI